MRNLTVTLCLTFTILLGSAGMSASGDLQEGLALQKGLTAYKSGDYATALREWEPFAEQGPASLQSVMGSMYQEGKGVPQNDKIAVKWYNLAAEQGYAPPSLV